MSAFKPLLRHTSRKRSGKREVARRERRRGAIIARNFGDIGRRRRAR